MQGVLLSVAISVLIRIKPIVDAAAGPNFLRTGLLVIGLATMLVAALMLTVTADVKRMLAYSSMENMGLIAIAAAAGTTLAIAALLLHVLAHGIGKTVLFLAGGQLQLAHGSTAIADITGVVQRSRLLGVSFAVGLIVLLGLPPFAMFASELAIARVGSPRCPARPGSSARVWCSSPSPSPRWCAIRAACCSAPRPLPPLDHRPRNGGGGPVGRRRRLDRPGHHRGSAHRPVHRRRGPARSGSMSPDWPRHRLSGGKLADRAEELLAEGYRLGLVAAHDDGDRLRIV